jgi:hypothetical protein
MYWPWSFRLARRAADSLSLRPRRPGFAGPRVAAASAGAKRASARTIAPSDLRMAWTSLPTDLARAFGKRASVVDVTRPHGTTTPPGPAAKGAEPPYRAAPGYPRGTPEENVPKPGYPKGILFDEL